MWCWSSFCCCYSSFVDVLHSHFLCTHCFYTNFVLSAKPIPEWFATLSFSTIPLSSYRESYGFKWAFFNHRRFFPYAPSSHFWHNLLLYKQSKYNAYFLSTYHHPKSFFLGTIHSVCTRGGQRFFVGSMKYFRHILTGHKIFFKIFDRPRNIFLCSIFIYSFLSSRGWSTKYPN